MSNQPETKHLTFDEFFETYRPQETEPGHGYHFDTNDTRLVDLNHQGKVWTYLSTCRGDRLVSGMVFVNRISYWVTELPHGTVPYALEINMDSQPEIEEENPEFEITKIFMVSTAHIQKETYPFVEQHSTYYNEFGALLNVHTLDFLYDEVQIPKDLQFVILTAQNLGCQYIQFDGANKEYPERMPTYEW